jgi:hypothetical protein
MRKIAAYPHEIESLINIGDVLFIRPVTFPAHIPDWKAEEIASVNMDGGGNWVAWAPYPATDEVTKHLYPEKSGFPCPYGEEGSLMWVQESYAEPYFWTTNKDCDRPLYRACENTQPRKGLGPVRWKSPITMPRAYSRLDVWVTAVSCKRVMDVTGKEAMMTGVRPARLSKLKWRQGFKAWWERTYVKHGRAWEENPFVWLVSALRT